MEHETVGMRADFVFPSETPQQQDAQTSCTVVERYQGIVRAVEGLLQDRAARYFLSRYEHGGADAALSDLLKGQCDLLTAVLEDFIRPHVAWFEEHARSVSSQPWRPEDATSIYRPALSAQLAGRFPTLASAIRATVVADEPSEGADVDDKPSTN